MTMEKNTKREMVLEYLEKYPPYNPEPLGLDIRALSRYADELGKTPSELTSEEVDQFKSLEN